MKTVCSFFLLFGLVVHSQSISISVDTVLTEKISIRALLPDANKIWYAADEGRCGFFDFDGNISYVKKIVFDSIKPDFRSIAQTSKSIFILNAGNPALLYQIDKSTNKPKLVYNEANKKAFYDSMQFWNDMEGIAIGDPTEDCFCMLITRDGGNSWKKISCADLPKLAEGEAAFAASNTNIVIKENKTWVLSGGNKARIFYSPDKGQHWEVFETPIIQGEETTGIYTADCYDGQTGFIAGGNYLKPEENFQNKAVSNDGGKTWKLVSENAGFGYASCVQYFPGSKGRELVSVGATGLWYSSDGGFSWKKLLEDKTLYTIRFKNENTAFAAGKNKIIRIRFKK